MKNYIIYLESSFHTFFWILLQENAGEALRAIDLAILRGGIKLTLVAKPLIIVATTLVIQGNLAPIDTNDDNPREKKKRKIEEKVLLLLLFF